jgi:hypothetical protein
MSIHLLTSFNAFHVQHINFCTYVLVSSFDSLLPTIIIYSRLVSDTFSFSYYIVSNDRMISEKLIGKGIKGSSYGIM